MKHGAHSDSLRHVGFKVPVWMLDAIDKVQANQKLVTRTEAARLIIVRGLDALGIDYDPADMEATA